MATNIVPMMRPAGIRACAGSGKPKPEPIRQKSSPSQNWWTPLFGWSSDPDYIDALPITNKEEISERSLKISTGSVPRSTRFAPGCFTEEKAKMLRMLTVETSSSSSHDMYHSAIASRLATDLKNRPDF